MAVDEQPRQKSLRHCEVGSLRHYGAWWLQSVMIAERSLSSDVIPTKRSKDFVLSLTAATLATDLLFTVSY